VSGGKLPPPVSDTPWSAAFVMQSLEVLPVFLQDGRVRWLRPEHAGSLRLGWSASAEPSKVVMESLAAYRLVPWLVHSTSWRHEGQQVVLTYVAVLPAAPAPEDPGGPLVSHPHGRVQLARGDATAPPAEIDVAQVLEHALRHLSWLAKDDPVVADELRDWAGVLGAYAPEPFRSL
jgi:hypothetical protein